MVHNGGRLQCNMVGPAGYFWSPFLNLIKLADPIFGANNSVPSIPETGDWPFYLNANNYPTAMPPAPAERWTIYPLYTTLKANDEFKLIFPPQHTVSIFTSAGNLGPIDNTPGAIVYKCYSSGNANNANSPGAVFSIYITAMSGSDWTGGLKLFLTKRDGVNTGHEELANTGEFYHPRVFSFLKNNSSEVIGTLRFMDFGTTNENYCRDLSLFPNENSLIWVHGVVNSNTYAGQATRATNTNAFVTANRLPGDPVAWTDGKSFSFRTGNVISSKFITSLSPGSNTIVNCTNHEFANGDLIVFARNFVLTAGWQALCEPNAYIGLANVYSVAVSNANSFNISFNSVGQSTFTGNVAVYRQLTISDGTLPAKRIVDSGGYSPYESLFTSNAAIALGIYDAEMNCVVATAPTTGLAHTPRMSIGVPISVMCNAANRINAHAWFCMPYPLSNAAMREYATTVFNNLDSGLLACFEHSNEVWNSIFPSFFQALHTSSRLFGAYSSGNVNGYAWKFKNMANAIAQVAGSRNYRTVYAVQAVANNGTWLEASTVSGGNTAEYPINKADWLAIANYYNAEMYESDTGGVTACTYPGYVECLTKFKSGNAANISNSFTWMANQLKGPHAEDRGVPFQMTEMATGLYPSWVSLLSGYKGRRGRAYGVKLVSYEGGWHLWTVSNMDGGIDGSAGVNNLTSDDVYTFLLAYLESEEHAAANRYYYDSCINAGIYIPSQFAWTGDWSTTNLFALQKFGDATLRPPIREALIWSGPAANGSMQLSNHYPRYDATTV
jgi:hypothetical protein